MARLQGLEVAGVGGQMQSPTRLLPLRCCGGLAHPLPHPHPMQGRYKIDVTSNPKASFKLRLACEKLKKTLSANPEAPLAIECLMDDVDVKAHVTREQLEGWAAPGLERLRKALQDGVAASGEGAAASWRPAGRRLRGPSQLAPR